MANTCTLSSKILFGDLCRRLEKLSTISRDKKVDYLTKYIAWFKELTKKVEDSGTTVTDDGFYPILRILLPQLDRERSAYGIKEHTLAKVYIRILCLPKEGQDASKLVNFRAPRSAGKQAGDFADVAYWILKNRCSQGGSLSVHDVNAHLDNIALKHAAHDPRGVDDELMTMLRAMSAEEQKWLIRVLLKDMKLGLGQSGVFNSFHPDARELYDVSNNLQKVCQQLKDPSLRLHEIEVSIFSPFRAMLAERQDVRNLEALMKKRPYFYVETKYDGERFQLHMSEGNFQYFSKNAFEYTSTYGSSDSSGLLTPYISKLLGENVHSCILDGEMMAWNTKLQCYRSKGMGFDVKSLKQGDLYRPCFCVFDILLLNGEILSNKTLEERSKLLNHLFTPSEGILAISKQKQVTTQNEVIEELNLAIDNRLEGVMLKDPTSVYKPNSRKGGWFKIKPEYTEGLMDHLDLLIIGGYHGGGKRKGIISHFLVAVGVPSVNDDGDETLHPKEFHSVCRVGSGYSMVELAELLEKLTPHWQRVKPGTCPSGIEWTKEKPDVWIDPRKSYILEIKATEIYYSTMFRTGCTLRFPRVEKIRYDKHWHECTTTVQLEQLRHEASGKLYSRHVTMNDAPNVSPPKKARQMTRAPMVLGEQFQCADLSEVATKSNLLLGKEFCVLSGSKGLSKQQIETKIVESGGSVVQNLRPTTFCAVASEETHLRVRTAVKSKLYDVARMEWLLRVLSTENLQEVPSWTPADLFSQSPATAQRLSEEYDEFGDSYTSTATMESLSYSLNQIRNVGRNKKVTVEEMADLDIELFSGPSPYGIFRLCYGYFEEIESLDVVGIDFAFYGGTITNEITEQTTHIILHSKHISREKLMKFEDINRKRMRKFHIMTESWIKESVEAGLRLEENQCHL